MTIGMPEWASAVPSTPLVHPSADAGFKRPFSQQQLLQMGADLLEQMLRRVVLAITHAFIPGIPAFEQLQQWADSIGDLLWWLEGDMLIGLVTEHIGDLLEINWLDPRAIWQAVTSSWDFWRGVVNWAMTVLKNITGIDLTEQSQFLKDLAALFALSDLQAVWVVFFNGWDDLNWSNPLQAIHNAWKLLVDLFWGVLDWFGTMLSNLTGIELPSFLEFDALKAAWTGFNTAWGAINWSNPLAAIHPAWMAVVDLFWDMGTWAGDVLRNLTGIDLPGFLAFSEIRAAWTTFFDAWGDINWSNPLTGIHAAWMLLVDLGGDIWAWVKTVLGNLTGITLPDFFNLSGVKALWDTFTSAWDGIDWGDPLAALHTAWMRIVDLVSGAWGWILGVIENLTGISIPSFFDTATIKSAWGTFTDAWGDINWLSLTAIWDALRAVGTLIRSATHWLLGVIKNLTGIDLETIADSFGIGALATALTTWASSLAAINWANPVAGLMDAIAAFIKLFQDIGNWLLGVIESWLGWNISAVGDMFSSVGAFIERIIEYFWGETGLGGWIRTIELIAGQVGAGIADALRKAYEVLEPIISTLSNIIDGKGFSDLFATVMKFFGGIVADITNFNLTELLLQLPVISTIVSIITGKNPGDGEDLGLGTLGRWARDVDKWAKESKEALDDLGQKLLGGLFPASQIGGSEPNLLSQGDFKVPETVTPNDGWEWDSTTATGTGGSLKHVSSGSSSTCYSRQSIKVAVGDPLTLSAQVRTASYSSGSMSLILIPWVGTTRYTSDSYTVTVATRSSAAASWTALTGNWTVPATVTSVTVALVSNVNSGCTAQFDDIYLKKTGGVRQGFVASLIDAWNELWRGLANPLGSPTTDKTWEDLFGAASGFRSLFNTEESRAQTLRQNMFGTPDAVGTSANLGFIPNIPRTKSTDMQTIINGIWRGLRGESTEDYTAADVYNAAYYTQESVAKAKAAVAELINKTASGDFSGVAVAVDFSTLAASSSMPSPWVNTLASLGSPTGSGQLGIGAGRAKWVTSTSDNRQTISIYNSATNTYYQTVTVVYSSTPNSNGAAVYIFCRSNSTGSTAVYAKLSAFKAELWKVSSGTHTRIGVNEWNVSGGDFLFYPGTYKLQAGSVGEEDRFKVWQDNRVVINVSDASAPKAHKLTGIGADTRTYTAGGQTRQALPADAAAFTFYDSTPAATLGSGFHIGRAGTTPEAYSTNTGGGVIPASFFGSTPSRKSDDLTWDNATNKVTVSVSGWYLVTVSLRRVMTANTDRNFAAAIILNGTLHAIGQQQWNFEVTFGAADATGTGSRHTSVVSMPVYLAKNEYVQAGYISNTGGDLAGPEIESYFSLAFLNNVKPVQPAAA